MSAKTIVVKDSVFDLNSMDEVSLVKSGTFTPAETQEAALAAFGNDSDRILAALNKALESDAKDALRDNGEVPFQVEDEEGNLTPFTGIAADSDKVNPLILSLAKNVFGFSKDLDRDAKRAAKESAKAMIKNNAEIKAGLQKTAVKK